MKDHNRNDCYGTQTIYIWTIGRMLAQVVIIGKRSDGKIFCGVFYGQNILLGELRMFL
jgi:hypothetical protein